jgi:mobilization protein NikA
MDTGVSPAASPPRRTSRPVRTRMVKLRVSEEEYAALKAKTEEAGMTLSVLLRDHVGKVRIRDRETERRRVAMLNRINANLNMIAKWVNTHKGAADTVSVMAHIVALEAEITRLLEAQDRA